MQIYDAKTGVWTNKDTGEVLKMNCGSDIDDISILLAEIVFNPHLAQSVYADMCKIVRGYK